MSSKKIEIGREITEGVSEVLQAAGEAGIPGIGLVARVARTYYDRHLQKKFHTFLSDAEIDQDMINKIVADENYSNHLYAALEAIRQTHSKIGVAAIALIYKDHWKDNDYLLAATRAFSQVSDKTLNAFLTLYESIRGDMTHLELSTWIDGEGHFHDLYNEAVELIGRNFFMMSTGASMHSNGPVQAMKWTHTSSYYEYCIAAKAKIQREPS
ncbi:hypothetical protein NF681_11370 [Comamonadaceae bacterium OTU4NAUVB1]|nr:hypothetical protein NF681_11370 [Comamonadaceae bacterium OTU4NAUVB1]